MYVKFNCSKSNVEHALIASTRTRYFAMTQFRTVTRTLYALHARVTRQITSTPRTRRDFTVAIPVQILNFRPDKRADDARHNVFRAVNSE